MTERKFLAESGAEVFTGNELLLKGGLEHRMALLTGYPGSPVSEVFDAVFENRDLLNEHGILGQMANNEALAAARLNGARMANIRAMAVMKSVGFHVAADGLAIGNLAEPNRPEGGAVVVVGDDPWNETTQIQSDSRFLAQHLHMPVLEPSTFQEIKDWIGHAFELSGACNLYSAYILTTNQADGGGAVRVHPNHYPTLNVRRPTELVSAELPVKDFVMIPPHTSQKEATVKARLEQFLKLAAQKGLNRELYFDSAKTAPLGFVTSGLSYCYLEQALFELGLAKAFPILKLGVTYPLDAGAIRSFLRNIKAAIVVEEKRPFLENQIRAILQEFNQGLDAGEQITTRLYGKTFPMGLPGTPEVRGLNASILIEKIGGLLLKIDLPGTVVDKARVRRELDLLEETARFAQELPVRSPTFCPGCPHRDSASVSIKLKREFADPAAMRDTLGAGPEDVIFHGESGCHSMLQFAPFEGLMQDYSGMGLGGGTGAGIHPFVTNRQVVFLGDSTFFHSGMIAVSDSLKNKQDITYVILDNKTTAMTGHQPTPGNDTDIVGRKTLAQDIEKIVRGMAGGEDIPIVRADPADRVGYAKLLEDFVRKPGVKIIIADKECAITFQRRASIAKKEKIRDQGFLEREEHINISTDVCEYCLECTRSTGCPGLTVEATEFGPKIATDLSTCVADGACAKGKVCPSFEKIIIHRSRPPKADAAFQVQPDTLPLPEIAEFGGVFGVCTFGVGGMGAGVVSSVLVRAGLLQGYQIHFLDKKGLAIRNGSVYGHVVFSKDPEQVLAPAVPYGKADVILGLDALETARGLDPRLNMRVASPSRTAAVVNTHKTPTVSVLLGRDDFNPAELDQTIQRMTRTDAHLALDFSELSRRALGSKLYANLLMIGAAFQRGLLPLSLSNVEKAVRESVSARDVEDNLRAFHLGRAAALNPEKYIALITPRAPGYAQTLEDKGEILKSRWFFGRKTARKYRHMVEQAVRWMNLGEDVHRAIAVRVYELIQRDGVEQAERYLGLLWDLYRKDRADLNHAATRAAVDNLFKVMAIKDEVYVAHLLTSREKLERDRARYGINPQNGDRVEYVHYNRPQFNILGFQIAFLLNSRNWMLGLMKRAGFLRKLLPEWHRREKEFRDWYSGLVRKFNYFQNDAAYHAYVEALKVPEAVRGYREIRYPLMELARAKAERLLSGVPPVAETAPSAAKPSERDPRQA